MYALNESLDKFDKPDVFDYDRKSFGRFLKESADNKFVQ